MASVSTTPDQERGSGEPVPPLAVFCASLVLALAPHRARWLVLAALLAVAMMWSRIYLSVHWLSDTFAGASLGFDVALILFWALPPTASVAR